METKDETLYVTGNSIKVRDMRHVLGEEIHLFKSDLVEIQGKPLDVSIDKIRRIYLENETMSVACEDTSFGYGKTASMVKNIIDDCEDYEGDLYNVLKAIAPNQKIVNYTSIVSYKDKEYEAFFECIMSCELCSRKGKGTIDPFAIPIECTVSQYINGKQTVIIQNQSIDNPEKLSICEQPAKRHIIHPRYFSLIAYKFWKNRTISE